MNDRLHVDRSAPPAAPQPRLWPRFVATIASITDAETRVARRGFAVEAPEVIERLETIGSHFVWGYNRALRTPDLAALTQALALHRGSFAGFVYEGAAMGLAVGDWMTPGRHWFDDYVRGPAEAHEYMAWVGLGWALARLPVAPLRVLAHDRGRNRGLNRWLALDGWGFHEGYFHWPRSIARQQRPRSLSGDAARVFDQGLGRSLWFVKGTDVNAVAAAIAAFAPARHADLWAGAGLAATYAGAPSPAALRQLRAHAGPLAGDLLQGVVFAAQARRRAGNPTPHTELACRELLGLPAAAAADIALATLPADGDDLAAYQRWRGAIRQRCLDAHIAS